MFERWPKVSRVAILIVTLIGSDLLLGSLFLEPAPEAHRIPHAVYHHGLMAGIETSSRWGDRTIPFATNSLGMKDRAPREIAIDGAGDHILFLGDSFTEGRGVTYEESFVGLVEDRGGLPVLNGGVSSFSPRLAFLRARSLLEDSGLGVRAIVLFIDLSDLQDELIYERFEPRARSSASWHLYWVKKFLSGHSVLARNLSLFEKSALGQLEFDGKVFPELEPMYARFGDPSFRERRGTWTFFPDTEWIPHGRQLILESARRLLDLCRRHDVRLVLAIYPWPQQVRAGQLDNAHTRTWTRFARNEGVPLLNLFRVFGEDGKLELFIPGDIHWNAAGHRRVADELLPFLHEVLEE